MLSLALATALLADPSVVVGPIDYSGADDEGQSRRLTEAVTAGLEEGGTVKVHPHVDRPECATDLRGCLLDEAREAGALWVILPRVAEQNQIYRSEIELVAVESGETLASSARDCEICGIADAAEMVSGQARALMQRAETLGQRPGVLAVAGEPEGATIFVDGEEVGVSPIELALEPGEHTIEARKDGFLPSKRRVTAVSGVEDPWQFTLTPKPNTEIDIPPPPKDHLYPTGLGLLGGGAVFLGVGIAFIVIEERNYPRGCEEDGAGECERRWRSLEFGAAMTAIGGVAVVTGVVLTAVGAKRRRDARRAQVVPTPRGLAIRGRF